MKLFFTLLLCLVSIAADAQAPWVINFDNDTIYQKLIEIDTINYKRNNWQIGKPNKAKFTSALSVPNAIITDTSNPYTANDTSVFVLKIPYTVPELSSTLPLYELQFSCRMHKDSTDIATVTASVDSGQTWINISDSLPSFVQWYFNDTPDFNKNDYTASCNLSINLNYTLQHPTDTLYLRFTFISDANVFAKDGWMIDNIEMKYYYEDIVKLKYDKSLITLYPNPNTGNFHIKRKGKIQSTEHVEIYDIMGRLVYHQPSLPANGYVTTNLPGGLYTIRYTTSDAYTTEKMVVRSNN